MHAFSSVSDRNSESNRKETVQIRRVMLYAFLLNAGLAGLKIVLALNANSLAITASVIDSATDSIASLAVYIGIRLSTKKTSRFPLGLYKIENVLSVVIAIFIFSAGYEIARNVVVPGEAPVPNVSLTILILLGVATAATFLFGKYAQHAGKRTESPTLIAEGKHRQMDVLSSGVVLASAALSFAGVHFEIAGVSIDQIGAAIVLIFIVRAGWDLLKSGMRVLLDASLEPETLSKVRQLIEAEPAVSQISGLVGRNAGRFRFIQATIALRVNDLAKAHSVSERIESAIKNEVSHVERVVIHYEPQKRTHLRVAIPIMDDRQTVSHHFGESPYFLLCTVRLVNMSIADREILENPYDSVEKAKGIKVAEWLTGLKIDAVLSPGDTERKAPAYVFGDAGIETYEIKSRTVEEAIHEAFGTD